MGQENNGPGKRVAIIGFGLLGASLGLALRGKGYRRVCWARRGEVRDWAVANDAADEAPDTPEDALSSADLTVLALPIPQILAFLPRYASAWRKGALVTDIGSTKLEVAAAAKKCLPENGVSFIGSHPMAGTEKSGHENAFPSLYENADVFLCPDETTREEDLCFLENFWRALNTHPVRLSAAEHDDLVAHTSHVLHLVASALSLGILGTDNPHEQRLRFAGCATGFRDTARIASSSPAMWREIMEHNTPAVLKALATFQEELDRIRALIQAGRYDEFQQKFAEGKALRDAWLEYKKRS